MVVRAAFLHCEELDRLKYPEGCPFNTSRAGKTLQTVQGMGWLSSPERFLFAPERATDEQLLRFHKGYYLDALKAGDRGEPVANAWDLGLDTPDCPLFRDMYAYTTLATGATLTGTELLLNGKASVAFNPSGGFHHAQPGSAAGFCYLNDVVLGCMALAEQGNRVLFIDLDVHHCDGVQEAFFDRSDIFTCSFHETGKELFPGTGFVEEIGEGPGKGHTVNVPLPVGTYDGAYLKAFRAVCLPLIDAYDPHWIVLELGMDGLAGDPLAHLHLTNNVYADAVEMIAKKGKPILAVGGGGYNIENTVRAWSLLWAILCGEAAHDEMSFGLGGVMLESTEWHGGLRDRALISHGGQRQAVDHAIQTTVEKVKRLVFPYHGL